MEFRRARQQEEPDPWLVERHEREIFPLLHRRAHFSGVENFRFYDFEGEDGTVVEDVIAYGNRSGSEASLVMFHNRYAEVTGRIAGDGLLETLGLQGGEGRYTVFRDFRSGLEHLVSSEELAGHGFEAHLEAFQYRVLVDFREVTDSEAEPFAELCRELSGRGVPDVRESVKDLHLRPLFEVFGDLLDTPLDETEALVGSYRDLLEVLPTFDYSPPREAERRFLALQRACESHLASSRKVAEKVRELESALLAWMTLEPLDQGVYERLRFQQEMAAGQHSQEEPFDANLYAEVVPLMLEFAPIAATAEKAGEILAPLLEDERAIALLGVNTFEGKEYFNREAYRLLTESLAVAGSVLQVAKSGASEGLTDLLAEFRELEERSGYRVAGLRPASATEVSGPSGAGRSDG